MMQSVPFNTTSDYYKIQTDLGSLRARISTCENKIYEHDNSLYGDSGPVSYNMKQLTQSLERVNEQIINMKLSINALECCLQSLKVECDTEFSKLRALTEEKPVEPKEKCDLEIFEQNIDNEIKNYIDLDDIANGKELWEPYDANWWNR